MRPALDSAGVTEVQSSRPALLHALEKVAPAQANMVGYLTRTLITPWSRSSQTSHTATL